MKALLKNHKTQVVGEKKFQGVELKDEYRIYSITPRPQLDLASFVLLKVIVHALE